MQPASLKKHLLLLFLCFQLTPTLSQLCNEEKNEYFVDIWILLKYYHLTISDGDLGINQWFIKEYQKLQSITTNEAFDTEILNWITSFGIEDFRTVAEEPTKSLFTENQYV